MGNVEDDVRSIGRLTAEELHGIVARLGVGCLQIVHGGHVQGGALDTGGDPLDGRGDAVEVAGDGGEGLGADPV